MKDVRAEVKELKMEIQKLYVILYKLSEDLPKKYRIPEWLYTIPPELLDEQLKEVLKEKEIQENENDPKSV